MGIIRGALLTLVCVVLFFSFLAMNTSYTIGSSLGYNHVEGQLTALVQNITGAQPGSLLYQKLNLSDLNISQVVQQHKPEIESFCANYSNYSFDFQGYNLSLPCNQINQGKNVTADSLINQSVKSFVQGIYYKKYPCGFWNCFGNNTFPFFLVSQQAQDYWMSKFYTFLIASLILIALMFFFLEKKLNLPIVTGSILILASLPLLKLGSLFSMFLGYPFIILFNIFFNQAQNVFWISAIISVILIACGIALRVVNSGVVSWLGKKIDESSAKSKGKTVQSKPTAKTNDNFKAVKKSTKVKKK